METLIKEALKKAGLPEALWDKIKVTSATEIESAVANLVRTERDASIREALKKAGIPEDELDKHTQSISDNRVSEAVKTHDDKLKADKEKEDEVIRLAEEEASKKAELEKIKEKDKDMTTNPDKDQRIEQLTTLVGTVVENITKLTETVNGVQNNMSEKDRIAFVSDALKEAKISEDWSEFVTETEPDKIKTQIEGLKGKFTTQRQIDNDKIVADGGTPAKSAGSDVFADQTVADFAKRQTGELTEVGGLASRQVLAK